jgi:hypothetical protein
MLTSAPAACSWGTGRLDVFVRGIEGALWHKWYGPLGWSEWTNLGGFIKPGTDPAAVAWGGNRVDVFVIGSNDSVWHKGWNGSAWSSWEDLGLSGGTPSGLGACVQETDLVALFVGHPNGSVQLIRNVTKDSSAPSTIENLGGNLQPGSSPAVIGGQYDSWDVFIRGTDDSLLHKKRYQDVFFYSDWSGWMNLAGDVTSSPAACQRGWEREVFVRASNNCLYQRTYTTSWSSWKGVSPEPVASSPAAASWGSNRIDLFVRGTDNTLWHKWWDGADWLP